LAGRIRTVQDPAQGGDRAYGAPRVTAELNDGAATVPDQAGRKFPDLLGRELHRGGT
jgi:hypothetical protein